MRCYMGTFPEYRLIIFNSYVLLVPKNGTHRTWINADTFLLKQETLSLILRASNRLKFVNQQHVSELENELADNMFNKEKFFLQEYGDDDYLLCKNIPEIAITNKDRTYNAIIRPSYFFYSPEKEEFHIAWEKRRL